VEGLRTYFHTYEGVVKALERIDLEIRAGETVGLVGETGSGKTVTALSILRLVPSPPGKIESGRVFLEEPDAVYRARREYDAIALSRSRGKKARDKVSSDEIREAIKREISELRAGLAVATTDREKESLRIQLQAATSEYDILQKPEEQMREIRGNKISMIFQEPMTALNPVFTIGDQIAETLILHRRNELCRDVLKALELQMLARRRKVRGKRVRVKDARQKGFDREDLSGRPVGNPRIRADLSKMEDEEWVCGACGNPAPTLWDYCPSCGARLGFDLWAPVRGFIMSMEKKLYTRMRADPKDQLVDFVNSIRILRRLVRNRLSDEGLRWAVKLLDEVRIPEPERIAGQYPFELSGGMRQRSMIAMMMACNPKLLIADEPTTALDVTVEAQILRLMKDLQAKTNMAILLITHDLGIVAEVSDKVGVMYAGNIAEFGTTEQVFHRMMHPYTYGLMQSIPRFQGVASEDRKKELYIIQGTVPNLLHPPSGCRFHPRCPRALEICKEIVPPLEEAEPGHLVACHNPVPRSEVVTAEASG